MRDERFDRIDKRLDELVESQNKLAEGQHTLAEGYDKLAERQQSLADEQKKLADEQYKLAGEQQNLADGQQKLWVLFDDQRRLLLVVADGVASMNDRMDRGFAELRGELRDTNAKMDTFVREQSELNREFRGRFSNHEERIQTLERRQ